MSFFPLHTPEPTGNLHGFGWWWIFVFKCYISLYPFAANIWLLIEHSNPVLIRLSLSPLLCWRSSIKGESVFQHCYWSLTTQSRTEMKWNECRAMAGAKHSGVNPLWENIQANFSLAEVAQRSQLELRLMFPYEVKSDGEWSEMVHYRFVFHIRPSELAFARCTASA